MLTTTSNVARCVRLENLIELALAQIKRDPRLAPLALHGVMSNRLGRDFHRCARGPGPRRLGSAPRRRPRARPKVASSCSRTSTNRLRSVSENRACRCGFTAAPGSRRAHTVQPPRARVAEQHLRVLDAVEPSGAVGERRRRDARRVRRAPSAGPRLRGRGTSTRSDLADLGTGAVDSAGWLRSTVSRPACGVVQLVRPAVDRSRGGAMITSRPDHRRRHPGSAWVKCTTIAPRLRRFVDRGDEARVDGAPQVAHR